MGGELIGLVAVDSGHGSSPRRAVYLLPGCASCAAEERLAAIAAESTFRWSLN